MAPSVRERYEILGELNRGGMGRVMRARDRGLGREVAIKVMTGRASSARFRREAVALAAVDSPAVVQVHDFGVEHDQPYLIMELIRGRSLAEWVTDALRSNNEPPPWHETIALLSEVARGLAACHARGLAHRDVKPENIMIEDARQRAVLIDFGLARSERQTPGFTQDLTRSGELLGTPAFMSPEQLDPQTFGEAGPAGDVWSLGATLFYALTGAVPYAEEGTGAAFYAARLSRPPRPISERRAGIPRWLSELCQRCLILDPAARPTPLELAERLSDPPRGQRGLKALVLTGLVLSGLAALLLWGGFAPAAAPSPRPPHRRGATRAPGSAPRLDEDATAAALQGLLDEGRYTEAEFGARRALLDRPRSARLRVKLAKSLHGQVRLDEAVDEYNAAILLDDSSAVAFTNRGEIFTRRGELDAALADFERAVALDSEDSVAHNNRAAVQLSLGRPELARAGYDRALALDASNLAALRNRSLLALNQQRWADALRDLDRLLELAPEDWSQRVLRAEVHERMGRPGLAARDRAAAIALDPHARSMIALNQATPLLVAGRSAEALRALDLIATRDPTFPEVYGIRAELRLQLGQARGALADLKRFLDLAPPQHQYRARARAIIASVLSAAVSAAK